MSNYRIGFLIQAFRPFVRVFTAEGGGFLRAKGGLSARYWLWARTRHGDARVRIKDLMLQLTMAHEDIRSSISLPASVMRRKIGS